MSQDALSLCCLGEGALAFSVRACRSGVPVTLVVADADDARRVSEMVAHVRGLNVSTRVTAGVCILSEDWIGPAPRGAMRLGLDLYLAGTALELRNPEGARVAHALGLHPVVTQGGVMSGLFAAIDAEAEALILEGAVPWELDEALEEAGFSQTVFARQDAEGVDLALARRGDAAPVMRRMVAEGRLGRKVAVGWYRYPGNAGRVVDPLIEDMVREEARFAQLTEREVTADECLSRMYITLMRAAARAVANGEEAQSVDRLARLGLGYPTRWSGPLGHLLAIDEMEWRPVLQRFQAMDLLRLRADFATVATGPISYKEIDRTS